jgi:hypothetical protein
VDYATLVSTGNRIHRQASIESRGTRARLSNLLQGHSFLEQLHLVQMASRYKELFVPTEEDEYNEDNEDDKDNKSSFDAHDEEDDRGNVSPYQQCILVMHDKMGLQLEASAFDHDDLHADGEEDVATVRAGFVFQDVEARIPIFRLSALRHDAGSSCYLRDAVNSPF